MDNSSEDVKTSTQNKVKVFVLTPDKVNQLGINLIPQLKTPQIITDEQPSTSKSISEQSIKNVSKDTSNTDKLGIIMKNKLSSILFKNIDSKLSTNEEKDVENDKMEVKRELNNDNNCITNLNKSYTDEIKETSIVNKISEKLIWNEEASEDDKNISDAEIIKGLNKIEKAIKIQTVQEKSINIGTIRNKLNFQISTSGPENVRLGGFKKSAITKNIPAKVEDNTSQSSSNAQKIDLKNNKTSSDMPDIEYNKNIEPNKPIVKDIQNTEKPRNIKILKIETIPANKNLIVISPDRLDSFKSTNIITSKNTSLSKLNFNKTEEINIGKNEKSTEKIKTNNISNDTIFAPIPPIEKKENSTDVLIETINEDLTSPKCTVNRKSDPTHINPISTTYMDEQEKRTEVKIKTINEVLINPKCNVNKKLDTTKIIPVSSNNTNEKEKPTEVKLETHVNEVLTTKNEANKESNNIKIIPISTVDIDQKRTEVKTENEVLTSSKSEVEVKTTTINIEVKEESTKVKTKIDDNPLLIGSKRGDNKTSKKNKITPISKINIVENDEHIEGKIKTDDNLASSKVKVNKKIDTIKFTPKINIEMVKNTEVKTKINVLTRPRSNINTKSYPNITLIESSRRKSGRVRKSTYSDKEYLLDIDLSRSDDEIDDKTPEIKTNIVEKIVNKPLDTSTSGPRKRGRPRKIKPEITENTNLDQFTDDLNVSTQEDKISENIPPPKRKVGRPRKQIKLEETSENSQNKIDSTVENDVDQDDTNLNLKRKLVDSEIECPRKKFSRKVNKTQESYEEMDDSTVSDDPDYTVTPNKSRAPITEEQFQKAVEKLNEFNVGKRTNEKLKEDEYSLRIINRYYAENGTTCGKCNLKIKPSKAWAYHNLHTHTNLGWRVGEPEIDLKDEKRVLNILHNIVKNTSKKILKCEKCGITKKSALGLVSHFNKCQKSAEEILSLRVTCTLCNKSYNRSSIKVHLATYHTTTHTKLNKLKLLDNVRVEENPKEDQNKEECNTEQREKVSSTRKKRKAAEKAINLIQEVVKLDEEKFRDKVLVTQQDDDDTISDKRFLLACRVPDNPKGGLYATGLLKVVKKEFRRDGYTKCKFKNCDYVAKNFEEIKAHTNTCSIPYLNDYICRLCHHTTKTKEEFKDHLVSEHTTSVPKEEFLQESNDSEDDIGDELMEAAELRISKNRSRPKGRSRIEFINLERDGPSTESCLYPAAYRWTLELHENNFSSLLFENTIPDKNAWNLIESKEIDNYLPVTKISMDVETVQVIETIKNNQGTERNWKKFCLFETEIQNDSITIYCGGPIWSIAWIPTPDDTEVDQYLAVSCLREHDRNYLISQTYSSSEMIQFWNFGPINIDNKILTQPKLEFCLAHEHGNIWCMEFCPSGCYTEDVGEDKLPRLGLLALACSDGSLPIYSIPLYKNDGDEIKIFKTKPAFSLVLNDIVDRNLGLWTEQVIKITWSKTPGHDVIAAGYTNGLVALWNLDTKSPLLRNEENGVTVLKPYHLFKAHDGPITAICFNPREGGIKWLFTGSQDKYLKYWNLEDTSNPNTVHFKHVVGDACWLSHWVTTIVGYDDSIFIKHTNSTMQAMRNFMCDTFTAAPTNSSVTSVSSNDWGNQFAQSNYAGELMTLFFHQLLASCDTDKSTKSKRLIISFVDLVDKTLTPEDRVKKIEENINKDKITTKKEKEENSNMDSKDIIKAMINKTQELFEHEETCYSDAANKYGLVFNHMNMDKLHVIPEVQTWISRSLYMKLAPVMLYPLTAINRTAWNPNKQAFLYIASAYNSGFIRLQCVRHMNRIFKEKK